MEFTMVSTAEWDGELIADFAPKRAALRELKMMRVRRAAAAGEARLSAHELQMVPIAQPNWLGQRGDELRDCPGGCVDDGCILVRGAVAVELASRLGFLACWDWLAVESVVAIHRRRVAAAVGLGARARLRPIGSGGRDVGQRVEG